VLTAGGPDVSNWTDIVQVAAGGYHTVGLKSNDTVLTAGGPDVSSWTDIVQVTAGRHHTVGLKSDGTVVAVGDNGSGQLNVDTWTGIVQVAAGWYHTVGLKSDGRVVAVGQNYYGECNVSDWKLLVELSDTLVVISPNGGEKLSGGGLFEITWASGGDIEFVKIDYSINGGTDWLEIVASTENDGSYDWGGPCEVSDQCLVRISDVASDTSDQSDAVFSIGNSAPLCECDLNQDRRCNILDYQKFIQDWGRTNCGTPPGSGNPPNDCECDLKTDGKCNILDYQVFIQDWGRTDCPVCPQP
jgi:hypothetical protein